MYKLIKTGVLRLKDQAIIPDSLENRDWREYQEWLAAGNTPQPADPEPVPDTSKRDNLLAAIDAIAADNAIPAKVRTFVTALKATL